ncbi:hypothetical protein [Actinoplanes sp. NPDC051494]|uniref:hypothetical protein n=1 Tax=Actinoplanes sp. NPDC051494 TaxID=3363907 RepID=UPI0037B771B3
MSETDSVATCTIAVHRGAWETICPTLPADAAAMVAPPVTVVHFPVTSVAPVTAAPSVKEARMRQNMPSSRHRRPN